MFAQVPLSKVLTHANQQAIKYVSHQDANHQLTLHLCVSPGNLLKETQHTRVQHQKVPIHPVQEHIAEGIPLVFKHERERVVSVASLNWWERRLLNQPFKWGSFFDVHVGFRTDLLDVVHHNFIHYFTSSVQFFHLHIFRDGGRCL